MATTLEFPPRFNAAEFFVDRNVEEGRGSSAAYHSRGAAISYAELLAGVNKAGNAFRQLDLRREERVALLVPDSPEFAYAFWGALKIGAVALPLNTFLSPADYEFMLRHSGAAALVVSTSFLPKVEPVLGKVSTLRTIIAVEEDLPAEPGTVSWAKLFQDVAGAESVCPGAADPLQGAPGVRLCGRASSNGERKGSTVQVAGSVPRDRPGLRGGSLEVRAEVIDRARGAWGAGALTLVRQP